MTGPARTALRIAVAAVYLAAAFGGLYAAAPYLRLLVAVATRPAVRVGSLLPPILAGLVTLLLLAALAHVLFATLADRRARPALAILAFLAAGLLPFVGRAGAASGPDVAPVTRLKAALDAAGARLAAARTNGAYPLAYPAADGVVRDEDGTPVRTGYYGHGRALPFRVVSRGEATGPVVTARPGDGPGTIYYAVDRARRTYWLTALLMDGGPVGPARFVRDADGRARVVQPKVALGR